MRCQLSPNKMQMTTPKLSFPAFSLTFTSNYFFSWPILNQQEIDGTEEHVL